MPTVKATALIVLFVVTVRAQWKLIVFEQLIKTHKYVTDCLQKGKEHPILNKYSSLYKREHRVMEQQEDFIGNPINMYLLIKRLTTDLDFVEKYIPWIRFDRDLKFPSKKHLQDSMFTLWRLQVMYKLNVTHLAAGKLYGHYSHDAKPYFEESLPMLIGDCLDLVQRMYWNNYYDVGLLWAVESYNKYHRKEPDEIYPNVDDSAIIHHIVSGYIKIGKYQEATEWTRKLMLVRPDMVQDLLYSEDPHHEAGSILPQFSLEQPVDLNFEDLEDLCRGKPLVQLCKKKTLRLSCYYKLGPNPFLRLAPFKAEQLHEKPPIFIFYDVVSDTNIETIHGLRKRLKPSTVSDPEGNKRRNQTVRTSDTVSIPPTWALLETNIKSTSEALQLRAEHFTDLSMESAEQLQVSRYSVGGHFRNHFDFFPTPLTKNGHRMATVLFYMSDVAQGGATVFREAQLTVWPVKGAALLWYNLLPSGQKDYHTSHAGCPVLRGSKWVISLWIYEYGQEFLRPCGLKYQENKEINSHNYIYYNLCT